MIHLKGCQRCGGDTVDGTDKDGDYWECFQCGAQTYPLKSPDPKAKDGWRKKKRKEYFY